MSKSWILPGILLLVGAMACGQEVIEDPAYRLDDQLGLHQVQALGTHNSYHIEPAQPADDSHRYTQPPLEEQLDLYGVRQMEWDVHLHQDGHYEVFHLPGLDEGTHCRLLEDCVQRVLGWSSDHPDHLPVLIWLELKDEVEAMLPEGILPYLPLEGRAVEVDQEIARLVPREKLFTPDDLRQDQATLPEAIAARGGWATLGELRGKLIFVMLENGASRQELLEGTPALEGRSCFVRADEPTDAFAALFKIDNGPAEAARITELVQMGFVVTSNTDSAQDSAQDNQQRLEETLAAGSNFVSSDFPGPVEGHNYQAVIPGGAPARCNPVSAPMECLSEDIEAP